MFFPKKKQKNLGNKPGERNGGTSNPFNMQACSFAKFLLLFSTLNGNLPASIAYIFTPLKIKYHPINNNRRQI